MSVDFALSAQAEGFRQEVRAIIRQTITPQVSEEQHRTGTFHSAELNKALAERGFLERVVPGDGRGDPLELWALFNELDKAGAPYDSLSVALMVASVISRLGTPWQKAAVLPAIYSGEALVAMGYSESDHGSDLASVTTRADLIDDVWVLNGAKMWTTMAHKASWVVVLARTDQEAASSRGLTTFIVPMETPGITVDRVDTMSTVRTNATFYSDVKVGPEWVLGDVNKGWNTLMVALAFERGIMGGANVGVPLLRRFRHFAAATGLDRSPITRTLMARAAIDNEVAKLLSQRAAWIAAAGGLPSVEGSVTKLFATEAYRKATEWFHEAAGAAGLLRFDEPGAAADGWLEFDARQSPVTTIFGGTSEISRNLIAERHLGLPRRRP